MIIGMPIGSEKCPKGHDMTIDSVRWSEAEKLICLCCLREDGLSSKNGYEDLDSLGLDFVRVRGKIWVEADTLRAAYEDGEKVEALAKALGRSAATIRKRIAEAGGVLGRRRVVEPLEPIADMPPHVGRMLHAANRALAHRWEEQSSIARINEEATRLAEELMIDVNWYDPWHNCEPTSDLSVLYENAGLRRRHKKPRQGVLAMITLTKKQRAQLKLLAVNEITQSDLVRRLISEHAEGSELPTNSRGDHSMRFPLSLANSEQEQLRALARYEGLPVSVFVRALISREARKALMD